MNCEHVQVQLSEYLEKLLEPETLKYIETHLSACAVCRVESYQLSESIRQVANLALVDPPLGFTQRVMTHVQEIENAPSLWEQLLFPLRIKIPLHATAAVLIAVFAVYLFEKQDVPKPLRSAMPLDVAAPAKRRENEGTRPSVSFAPAEERQASLSAKVQTQPAASSAAQPKVKSESKDNESVRMRERRAIPERAEQSPAPAAPPVEARRSNNGTIPTIPVAGGQSAGAPEMERLQRQRLGPIEPFANYELVFRRRGQLRDQARRENVMSSRSEEADTATALRSSMSDTVERLLNSIPDEAGAQTIWFSIPKKEYEQLKKDLRSVGTIESELPVPLLRNDGLSESEGPLQIKFTVVPGTETNRAPQATPTER